MTFSQSNAELSAKAAVANAVCRVFREVIQTGTDEEVQVAHRCYRAALEAAELISPRDQLCKCPYVVRHYLARPGGQAINPDCPWHGDRRNL